VLDTVGVDRVAVVGHGFGAAIALAMASRQPERVAGLFLVDAPADLNRLSLADREALRRALSGSAFEDTLAARKALLLAGADAEVRTRILGESLLIRREAYVDSELSLFDFDPAEALAGIRARALPVSALHTSSRDDDSGLQAHHPELSSRRLPGVSHWPMLDDPATVHTALDAWLRGVDAHR